MLYRSVLPAIILALWFPHTGIAADYILASPAAAPFQQFGTALAISGNQAIVGGNQKDSRFNGQETGAAYVFNTDLITHTDTLIANDAGVGDQFGSAISASNGIAVIGAHLNDARGKNAGAAYLFDLNTGAQLHQLTADGATPFDRFGWSVAISSDVVVVGARADNGAGVFSGAAYLFDTATGTQLHKLTTDDNLPSDNDFFGWSVAINGDFALVGAPDDDRRAGAVYVFDVTTGDQVTVLRADDAVSNDRFGTSIAVSGNTAIVGSRDNSVGGDFGGAAYVFDLTTGTQISKLVAEDATPLDRFGWSVDLDGDIAIVGAYLAQGGAGAGYLFNTTTGQQLGKLPVIPLSSGVGWSVAVEGSKVALGAPFERNDMGVAFLLDVDRIIPEPSTLVLLTIGVVGISCGRTKRA